MMMAMLRLNVPSVFIYGGSILPGKFQGRDVTVQDVFEAVGRHSAGKMDDDELGALERVACPSGGSCGGQFTANTMACVAEAIGLALPNSTAMPAPYESRDEYSDAAGRAVMRMIAEGLRPRDIVTAPRWRTPRPSSPLPAAPPMPGCICRRWPTRRASSSRSTMSPKSSSAPLTSPTSSPAGAMSPRTFTRPAASPSSSRRCSTAASSTATA